MLILGAYPSALHVRWEPPKGMGKPVRAIAVDNEPVPFWNGAAPDECMLVDTWRQAVNWQEAWGGVTRAGTLNGSSGVWVDKHVLRPFGLQRDTVRIADCLDIYCVSDGGARRVADTYNRIADGLGLRDAVLPSHPSEAEIVASALRDHRDRLLDLLRAPGLRMVVTLGNAALRAVRSLVESAHGVPTRLRADASYGIRIALSGPWDRLTLLPLAHPAAPKPYQDVHASWLGITAGKASAAIRNL